MAGLSVDGGKGKRRNLDSEINMIPMIDLLMVTISFLLITAVWVHSQRLVADAQVPGSPTTPPCEGKECEKENRLHVETRDPGKYVLSWKNGATVVRTLDVPRDTRKSGAAIPALATKIDEEWKANGAHRDAGDRGFDHAVVHASNDMSYGELIAVMDAVEQPKRLYGTQGKQVQTSAFSVTFAMD